MASGYHHQELAPSGCSHAIFLHLHYHSPAPSTSQQAYQHRGRLQTQLVTARDDVLTIYDVYGQPHASASTIPGISRHTATSSVSSNTSACSHKNLVISRNHTLFGAVTGLQRVQTLASDKDSRDRLLVSFKDAKLALLEWNDAIDDLETISIHTYERAPQLLNLAPHLFHPILNVDPLSRCAALLLPHDSLAILPFYRDAADFDFDLDDHLEIAKDDVAAVVAAADLQSLPYSPSFVLTMREVDPKIRNLKHFCFLPGFQKPTVAVLFSHNPTWTGLLSERKDTFSVYLFTLDLSASLDGATFSSSAEALDDGTARSAHPVVTTSTPLPYDCLYMVACPQTLGGVIVVCMSSLLHVDQSGRVMVTALNQWFKTTSAIEPESILELSDIADLQGSQLVFTSKTQGVLTLVNGEIYRFRCQTDGRSVEGIRLERMQESFPASQDLVDATGPPPSCLAVASHRDIVTSSLHADSVADMLFCASMAGDSSLYHLVPVKKPLRQDDEVQADQIKEELAPTSINDMDLDLDDDLYGTSDVFGSTKAKSATKEQTVITVSKVDQIRSYGGLHSFTRRKLTTDEPGSSKRYGLVGACGSGNQAGLVYLDPRFVPESRRELVAATSSKEQAGHSDESVPAFSKVFVVGSDSHGSIRMIGSRSSTDSSIAFSCSAQIRNPTSSQQQAVYTDIKQLSEGATICAGGLVGGDAVARITANNLQILSLDSFDVLSETVVIDPDQGTILHASLDADQFAVVHTSEGATLLYRYDASQSQFELVDVSTALGTTSAVLSANVFRDSYGDMERARGSSSDANAPTKLAPSANKSVAAPRALSSWPNDDEEVDYGEDDEEPPRPPALPANGDRKHLNGGKASLAELAPCYLFVLDSDGVSRIWSLPEVELVWQNASLSAQPQRLRYEQHGHAELAPEQKAVLTMAVARHIGDMLCIVSLTSDHFLVVYRSNAWASADEVEKLKSQADRERREKAWRLTFNKVFVLMLSVPAGGARSFDSDSGTSTVYRSGAVQLEACMIAARVEHHGASSNAFVVLGGGREAQASVLCWTEAGGYRLLDWPDRDLSSLASISAPLASTGSVNADFVFCDRAGRLYLGRLPAGLDSSTAWPSSVVRTGREYTNVVAHDPTSTVIAASVSPCRFMLFDEDGEAIHDEQPNSTLYPSVSQRGSLELFISQHGSTPVDGYEFEANETVTSLEIVTLDSPSTVSGRKQFVAAGTTTFHGEDRTAKGSVYLFEIISAVSAASELGSDLRLKLVCRDDSRAPVTAISHINGYLISTCGQKLYVRALEKQEWLISIAFLDCPFYITSIEVVKNLVLLGDCKRGLGLWAFQEDPYKFVELAKAEDGCVGVGAFLVRDEKVSMLSISGSRLGGDASMEASAGVIRLYEYAPHLAVGGKKLVLRSEFQTTSEAVARVECSGRWLSDSELRGRETLRNKVVFAKANGSVESVAAVDEKVGKRLHLLQGQLVRSVMHTAALNPRSFRMVRNDYVPRALVKGVLDARLLDEFMRLSRPKMLEAVKTLVGMWDGLDNLKPPKRKRDALHPDTDQPDDIHHQDSDHDDFQKQDHLRLLSQHKRVQLVLKDLSRLRSGFERV